jgi:hypothetical protein
MSLGDNVQRSDSIALWCSAGAEGAEGAAEAGGGGGGEREGGGGGERGCPRTAGALCNIKLFISRATAIARQG